jgi:molecular chaperone GrpE
VSHHDHDTAAPKTKEQVAAWLEEATSLPAGLAPEVLAEVAAGPQEVSEAEDFYGVWAALTVLAQEVRLQGRYFSRLQDRLEREPASNNAAAVSAQLGELRRELRQRASQEMVQVLIDLHDRLVRGQASAAQQLEVARHALAPRWYHRLMPRRYERLAALLQAVTAVHEGYTLSLQHLEEALSARGVRRLPGVGHPFDPSCMLAVEVDRSGQHAEGEITDVYVAGYAMQEQVLRTARVCVAREAPSDRGGGEGSGGEGSGGEGSGGGSKQLQHTHQQEQEP